MIRIAEKVVVRCYEDSDMELIQYNSDESNNKKEDVGDRVE